MEIARVFPRKTTASPDDEYAFFDAPGMFPPDVDEIHVSITFKYDLAIGEKLAELWKDIAPVKIGGPATGMLGGDFVPGMYLKKGYVITSRGCPNKCWFCDVWKRDGNVRELPVTDGWILQDDNIFACSREHIKTVFSMLKRQKQPIELRGCEAARLDAWTTDMLWDLRPRQMFFAYDTPDDFEPLVAAGKMLRYADFTRSHLRCYCLIGYPGDTMSSAEERLIDSWKAGFLPCAMLYENNNNGTTSDWKKFHRSWMRPASIRAMLKGTTETYF